ncbi:DUF6439 family protein [Leptolyngbya ohadii]|uniref:DUF6439 family protein n=1 Tax=Leptolyngbya ohadii TaxID=1962290 RepID=UPI001CED2897|nr:DUF6439 family protein [Leptolyngbya ohadii]
MPESSALPSIPSAESLAASSTSTLDATARDTLAELSTLELAQALAERLSIAPQDWHRLKANRNARASEQAAIALVYLLRNNPQEALPRLQQAGGWIDRSISAPPCPTHGH